MKFSHILTIVFLCFSFPVFANAADNISLNFTEAKTQKVLNIIANFSGKGLVLPDSNLGVTSVYFKKVPWREALKGIAISENLNITITENLIVVSKGQSKTIKFTSKERQNKK